MISPDKLRHMTSAQLDSAKRTRSKQLEDLLEQLRVTQEGRDLVAKGSLAIEQRRNELMRKAAEIGHGQVQFLYRLDEYLRLNGELGQLAKL